MFSECNSRKSHVLYNVSVWNNAAPIVSFAAHFCFTFCIVSLIAKITKIYFNKKTNTKNDFRFHGICYTSSEINPDNCSYLFFCCARMCKRLHVYDAHLRAITLKSEHSHSKESKASCKRSKPSIWVNINFERSVLFFLSRILCIKPLISISKK